MEMKATLISNSADECGEAPVWDSRNKTLFWVDTEKKECHSLNTTDGTISNIDVDGFPQALGYRKDGGWICPMDNRVVLLDANFRLEKDLGSPLPEGSPLVLGDGTSGPDGAYYFGVYDPFDVTNKEGAVYRVSPDLSMEEVIGDMALPNGMAFTPEGDRFYLTEMFGNCIWTFDFNTETGEFSNKTLFATVPKDEGYPDGLILDETRGVWSGHWQGFRVTCYTPEGTVKSTVSVPVPTAPCMAFGDDGELYITSARKGCSEAQLKDYPESGGLFVAKPMLKGVPERLFLG